MSTRFLTAVAAAGVVMITSATAHGQDINLTGGNADAVWTGPAGSNAGLWMDQGAVSGGDGRRDLIVGAPGGPGVLGRVYVINGGPSYTGSLNLATSTAATFTGVTAGDLFGSQTAAGNILTTEASGSERNLLVSAPNANGGNGVVYLFTNGGASANASAATYTIVGAPGDQLGTALATADLNADGYREIIMGAPGNDRIWIVLGGPALSGTRDLAVSPTHQIGGSGTSQLGRVIAAADVTADGITDLLVGSPEVGSVYLYKGAAGAVPTFTLAAHFDATAAGQRVGESIRLGDVDSDDINDIIIGAPGIDGPDGSRTDAGAVYVIWGANNLTTRLVTDADVTFHGQNAGDRLGTSVTSGDINRDTPADLVMLATGASGGAGQLVIYYGSSARTSYGVDLGNGRRRVDLQAGGASRRIIGDPATGVIRSAQVFEVTGEGARDVIVGVPTASSNAGHVYFTVSPRLRLNDNKLTFRLEQNTNASGSLQLSNPSTIAATWSATVQSGRPWVTVTPSGSTVNGGPATITIFVSAAGLAATTVNTATITVRSTSTHLEMALPITVTLWVRAPSARVADFNGDRLADFTVFRPGNARWYTRFSGGPANLPGFQWGLLGDIPAPADYDGDRKVDVAVYRPGTPGGWFVYYSSTNSAGVFYWGESGDQPVPADYDGDGRADFAVFRPSTAQWWIVYSSTSSGAVVQWGLLNDRPVPGDYDGDGRTDIAVYRPGNGTWYVRYARGGTTTFQWGTSSDVPVPADYDADGALDFAVFRPSTATWWIWYSAYSSGAAYQWGLLNDMPIPTDVNGDGSTDLVVFRPSNGTWYIWYAWTTVKTSLQWGLNGDVPLPRRP